MPAWALKLTTALVLAMTLVGSVDYVSAHPKNPLAPLLPKVEEIAAAEMAGAIPEPTEPTPEPTPPPTPSPTPRPTPSPVPTQSPSPTRPGASPTRADPTVTPPSLKPTPSVAPTPRPTVAVTPARPTLAAAVRTASLKPVTRTRVS